MDKVKKAKRMPTTKSKLMPMPLKPAKNKPMPNNYGGNN